jgi:hypothetical protein
MTTHRFGCGVKLKDKLKNPGIFHRTISRLFFVDSLASRPLLARGPKIAPRKKTVAAACVL